MPCVTASQAMNTIAHEYHCLRPSVANSTQFAVWMLLFCNFEIGCHARFHDFMKFAVQGSYSLSARQDVWDGATSCGVFAQVFF